MPIFRANRILLDEFREGKPDALGAVYWEYVRKIERLLRQGFTVRNGAPLGQQIVGACVRPHDLADLVQEVFLRAFSERARRAYDSHRDYGPYLYTIARNVLVDWARKQGREIPASLIALDAVVDTTEAAADVAPWATPATMRLVEAYLAALPKDLYRVHELRYEQGLSQEKAAEAMGVGRQTLRTLEVRLRDGLALALDASEAAGFPRNTVPPRLIREEGRKAQ